MTGRQTVGMKVSRTEWIDKFIILKHTYRKTKQNVHVHREYPFKSPWPITSLGCFSKTVNAKHYYLNGSLMNESNDDLRHQRSGVPQLYD